MEKKPMRKIIEQEEEGNFMKKQIKEAVEKSSKLKETMEKSNILIPFKKFPKEFDEVTSRYVKKPIPVRAVMMAQKFQVETLEGIMTGKNGDYLIEGVEGEVYPCDKSIFEKTYTKYKGKEKQNYDSHGRGMLIIMLMIGAILYAIVYDNIPIFVIFMIVVLIVAELIIRYKYKKDEEKRKHGNKNR